MNSYRKCVCHFHCPLSVLSSTWMEIGIHVYDICTLAQSPKFNGDDRFLSRIFSLS